MCVCVHALGQTVALVGESTPLPALTLHSKAESVASVTSQCSFSSTIVHVGDKKPPESGEQVYCTYYAYDHVFLSSQNNSNTLCTCCLLLVYARRINMTAI